MSGVVNGLISLATGDTKGGAVSIGMAMIPGAGLGKISKAAQLLKNTEQGLAGEAAVAKELVAEGKTILGSRVGIRTQEGTLRVADHLVKDGKQVVNTEVKTGGATRTAAQVSKDASIASKGGKLVGKNAPAGLRGETVKIPTVVRKPQ